MAGVIARALERPLQSAIRAGASGRVGRYLLRYGIAAARERVTDVTHNGVTLRLSVPNDLCQWRAKTFASKEPETLEWIDALERDTVLWDVGANVGLYSVYAAKQRGCRVFAFEPSVFNLEVLARNTDLNGATDLITILPLALSDALGTSRLRLSTTEWGGALSTFGRNVGWDGRPIHPVFEFSTLGLSMDDAVERLGIGRPDYIKMDVDGIEHFILRGGASVLRTVREILLEVNDNFKEQAEQCRLLLTQAGLALKEKRHSALAMTTGFEESFNQIWTRG